MRPEQNTPPHFEEIKLWSYSLGYVSVGRNFLPSWGRQKVVNNRGRTKLRGRLILLLLLCRTKGRTDGSRAIIPGENKIDIWPILRNANCTRNSLLAFIPLRCLSLCSGDEFMVQFQGKEQPTVQSWIAQILNNWMAFLRFPHSPTPPHVTSV